MKAPSSVSQAPSKSPPPPPRAAKPIILPPDPRMQVLSPSAPISPPVMPTIVRSTPPLTEPISVKQLADALSAKLTTTFGPLMTTVLANVKGQKGWYDLAWAILPDKQTFLETPALNPEGKIEYRPLMLPILQAALKVDLRVEHDRIQAIITRLAQSLGSALPTPPVVLGAPTVARASLQPPLRPPIETILQGKSPEELLPILKNMLKEVRLKLNQVLPPENQLPVISLARQNIVLLLREIAGVAANSLPPIQLFTNEEMIHFFDAFLRLPLTANPTVTDIVLRYLAQPSAPVLSRAQSGTSQGLQSAPPLVRAMSASPVSLVPPLGRPLARPPIIDVQGDGNCGPYCVLLGLMEASRQGAFDPRRLVGNLLESRDRILHDLDLDQQRFIAQILEDPEIAANWNQINDIIIGIQPYGWADLLHVEQNSPPALVEKYVKLETVTAKIRSFRQLADNLQGIRPEVLERELRERFFTTQDVSQIGKVGTRYSDLILGAVLRFQVSSPGQNLSFDPTNGRLWEGLTIPSLRAIAAQFQMRVAVDFDLDNARLDQRDAIASEIAEEGHIQGEEASDPTKSTWPIIRINFKVGDFHYLYRGMEIPPTARLMPPPIPLVSQTLASPMPSPEPFRGSGGSSAERRGPIMSMPIGRPSGVSSGSRSLAPPSLSGEPDAELERALALSAREAEGSHPPLDEEAQVRLALSLSNEESARRAYDEERSASEEEDALQRALALSLQVGPSGPQVLAPPKRPAPVPPSPPTL